MEPFISVTEFQDSTGICIEQDIVEAGLIISSDQLRRKIMYKEVYEGGQTDNRFFLKTPIADFDASGIVDLDDIEVFELDNDFNEYDLKSFVNSFKPKYGFLDFVSDVPTQQDRKLRIEFYVAASEWENIITQVQELALLMTVNYVFKRIPFSKLQKGIKTWTLNGVTVDFSEETMQSITEANTRVINQMLHDLTPYYSQNTRLGMRKDDVNRYVPANIFNRGYSASQRYKYR